MKKNNTLAKPAGAKPAETPAWAALPAAALCPLLAAGGYALFCGNHTKQTAIAAGLGILLILALCNLERLRNWPTIFLMAYAGFSMLTAFWAMSGKFFLREYMKIFLAVFFFLLIATWRRADRRFARHVMGIISGSGALYAILSVEAAATGRAAEWLHAYPGAENLGMSFSTVRLSGIFGNSNVESSLYAIGILFAIALLCDARNIGQRLLWAAVLSCNAYAFLLVFSMGAIACFCAAVAVYLLFAGNQGRGAALLRMVNTAVPTFLTVFFAFRYFNVEGRERLPLLLMAANAAVHMALELLFAGRLARVLERHQVLAFSVLGVVVLAAAVYLIAALRLSDPYTFGISLHRSVDIGPGDYRLEVEADGPVSVRVASTDRVQSMTSGSTTLYSGPVEEAVFTVPEESIACDAYFSAEEGVTLISAAAVSDDGRETTIMLIYRLFPDFIANRIQLSLTTSHTAVERFVLMGNGLRLFQLAPVAGNGVGAFETGITRVQEAYFETRYVHNHYIQILLEDGVIGLALYAAALVSMVAALWKKRKQPREGAFFWLYPALCAEFVMSSLQMLWDVSMSIVVFTCFAWSCYALIVVSCAEPIAFRAKEAKPAKGKKERGTALAALPVRLGCMVLPLFFTLSVGANLYASNLATSPVRSYEELFDHLETAAGSDLYDHNDWKLSYVLSAQNQETHLEQADRYAAQLMNVQSNAIPARLVSYYIEREAYGLALDAAIHGAVCSASDARTWNNIIALLSPALLGSGADSPLLTDETLMPKLAAYRAMRDAYDENALRALALDETARAFFDTAAALEACDGDTEAMRLILDPPPEEEPAEEAAS